MSTLDLLSTDLTLTAPCGCSMRRAGSVDSGTGAIKGETRFETCALHGAAETLLRCLMAAARDFSIMRYGSRMPEWDAAIDAAIAKAEPPAPSPEPPAPEPAK